MIPIKKGTLGHCNKDEFHVLNKNFVLPSKYFYVDSSLFGKFVLLQSLTPGMENKWSIQSHNLIY